LIQVAGLCAKGRSIRQIAAALDRPPSTVSRGLKRNRGRQIGYRPAYAQQQTRARCWRGSRQERNAELRRQVLEGLKKGWSPEQVCGRLQRRSGHRSGMAAPEFKADITQKISEGRVVPHSDIRADVLALFRKRYPYQ
jgi:IS30 family transposase